MRGPRRSTAAELLDAVEQSELFEARSDGRAVLRTSKRQLARQFGIAPGSLSRRLATLVDAGLATDSGALVVDTDAIRARLAVPASRQPESTAAEPGRGCSVTGANTDAYIEALDSLAALGQIAADTGDADLGRVAAECIGSVSSLLIGPTRMRALVRAFDGASDANASPNARTSFVVNGNDDENESSHSHQPDANASPNARTREQVLAAERGFENVPDWHADDVRDVVVAPVVTAYAEATGRHISIDTDWFVGDLMAWPRAWVERAVGILVDQVRRRGPGIFNPGGLLARAVTEGWLEYFPLEDPAKVAPGGTASSWARVSGLRAAGRSRHDAVATGAISDFENRVWADCGSRLTGLPDIEARDVWHAAWRHRLDASDPPLVEVPVDLADEAGDVTAERSQQRLVGPRIGSALRRRGVPQHLVGEVGSAGDEAVRAGADRDSVVEAILASVGTVPHQAPVEHLVRVSLQAACSCRGPSARHLTAVEVP